MKTVVTATVKFVIEHDKPFTNNQQVKNLLQDTCNFQTISPVGIDSDVNYFKVVRSNIVLE
jgi:hypothetical protein